MKLVSTSELTPGMVTAEDVLTYDLSLIVPKNVILTNTIISRLESFSIYYVNVLDEIETDLFNTEPINQSQENSIGEDESAVSSKEKIKSSPQFQHFCRDFNACAEHFRDNLIASIYQDKPFNVEDIVSETLALLRTDNSVISVFDMLLNMKNEDDSVYNHSLDVALIANTLARWLHFSEDDVAMVTACGLFHDVGKFNLPQSILRKPGKLTREEFEIIKTHTTEGFHILSKLGNVPQPIKNAALMHHEKCDGSGYPYGLKGDEIDNFSKIITIADIFDAMTSERVYRKAICPFSVIESFEKDGLAKYEPVYILTFLENVSNSYLNHRVTLSNGMEGDVIFINRDSYSRPIVRTDENMIINLQEEYYHNILNLSGQKNVNIESII